MLGVPRTATEDEIRKEFRKLARKHHPDVNQNDKAAEEKFKEINEAYQVLSDPEKRKKYDELGPNWQAGCEFTPPPGWETGGRADFRDFCDIFGAGGQTGFSDFFESIFGRRAGAAGRGSAALRGKGETIDAEIALTLEEAHHGVTRRISLEAAEPCPNCGGTGTKDGRTCATCRGSGVVRRPNAGGHHPARHAQWLDYSLGRARRTRHKRWSSGRSAASRPPRTASSFPRNGRWRTGSRTSGGSLGGCTRGKRSRSDDWTGQWR